MSQEVKVQTVPEITFTISFSSETKTLKLPKDAISIIRLKSEINLLFPSISNQEWTLCQQDNVTAINHYILSQITEIYNNQLNLTIKLGTDNDNKDNDEESMQPVIIDIGSYSTKAGFSGKNTITCELPTKIGKPRHVGVMVGMAVKSGAAYVGGSPCIGFSVGGAKDINNFRDALKQNIVPKLSSITYTGIFYNYYFETQNNVFNQDKTTTKMTDKNDMIENDNNETKSQQTKQTNKDGNIQFEGDLFYPSYCYAKCKPLEYFSDNNDENDEKTNNIFDYYITCGLNSNIKQTDFKRNTLNLVIVLDISGSMGSAFTSKRSSNNTGSKRSKMQIANQCLCNLLNYLDDNDRFGLVLFDSEAIVFQKLEMVKNIDLKNLKMRIKSEIKDRGGTNLECGYLKAKELLDGINVNEDNIVRSNRIIYLTDMNPNSGITNKNGLLGLSKTFVENEIYSTFIGIGIDFNTDLVSYINKLEGCNYYSVSSQKQFKKRMNTEFEFMVTPLVFDLSLKLKSEGDSCCIDSVFGSNNDTNENIKQGETLDFEIMNVKTLFPSKKEIGKTKGGLIVIKLKKNGNNESNKLKFEIIVTYKDKFK
eukprot:88800_1